VNRQLAVGMHPAETGQCRETGGGFTCLQFQTSVARFFLVQHTQTGISKPNEPKINHMTIKHTNTFHFKTIQNLPKIVILV
jgi:hypothetical protein